jgi:enediyne biosynthesis protein E4
MHTLYHNEGEGNFIDATRDSGLANAKTFTGFGTGWFDYDNDGRLDLFVADGAVYMIESERHESYPYHERNPLFHNDGNGHLTEDGTSISDFPNER